MRGTRDWYRAIQKHWINASRAALSQCVFNTRKTLNAPRHVQRTGWFDLGAQHWVIGKCWLAYFEENTLPSARRSWMSCIVIVDEGYRSLSVLAFGPTRLTALKLSDSGALDAGKLLLHTLLGYMTFIYNMRMRMDFRVSCVWFLLSCQTVGASCYQLIDFLHVNNA